MESVEDAVVTADGFLVVLSESGNVSLKKIEIFGEKGRVKMKGTRNIVSYALSNPERTSTESYESRSEEEEAEDSGLDQANKR